MKILVTGGAGFIGSSVIRYIIQNSTYSILNLDNLTYASSLQSLKSVEKSDRYEFVKGDICNSRLVEKLLFEFKPDAVMHLAAESHVDQSIASPKKFIQTNIMGTYVTLECALKYWRSLAGDKKEKFKATVSIDGSLKIEDITGSIHQVGAKLQGLPSCNGWDFWHVKEKSSSILLDEIRGDYRNKKIPLN